MKDPKRIIQDVEKLDEMEFNPVQQPQLNEKVLKEKCKKLRETFERMPHAPSNIVIQDIPLPGAQPPSILKKTSAYGPPTRAVSVLPLLGHGVPHLPPGRKPPGPPLGPPPPQVLQMYGCKVGFALDLPARRRDEGMLYSPELAQWGHDDDVSSTSEDDGYPEDTEQDKHDDSPEDSDSDRSDGENMPGKSRKKKNMKELTPLLAMMLRMAGQEIPEEGREVEEFSEDDDEDWDDSKAEKQSQKQHKEESLSDSTSAASRQQAPPQSVPPSQIQAPPPCQDHLPLDHHLLHLYGHLDHLQAFLLDHIQELLRS
ncbi:hypothetical protein MG293_002271 [Ovis ammon polii]|uniref:Uncharacterized protein n=1 Tax=Ovis ammon polii TaxID=230172 RepID=A0AAD4YJL3_OVIAM|nr:hypothetical protein MG293_002271 [Ovis ammon polii]